MATKCPCQDCKPVRFVAARTHFVYSPTAGVHSAWDCREDALEAKRDPEAYGAPVEGARYFVYTRAAMVRMGVISETGEVR